MANSRKRKTPVEQMTTLLIVVIFFCIGASVAISMVAAPAQSFFEKQVATVNETAPSTDWEMAMELYEKNNAQSSNALPTWLIVIFFMVAIIVLLWRLQHVTNIGNKFLKTFRRGKGKPAPKQQPGLMPVIPLTGISPPADTGSTNSIEDVDWA